MAKLSGLQREVLSLFRQCLREVQKKPVVRIIHSLESPLGASAWRKSLANIFHVSFALCRRQGGTSKLMLGIFRLLLSLSALLGARVNF